MNFAIRIKSISFSHDNKVIHFYLYDSKVHFSGVSDKSENSYTGSMLLEEKERENYQKLAEVAWSELQLEITNLSRINLVIN